MKPLIVLLVVFGLAMIINRMFRGSFDVALSARTGLSAMLLFTAIGHFAFTKGMSMMIPAFIPYKTQMVYLTGVVEIAAATGLLIPRFRVLTGWLLIVFFIMVLPANIYAAVNKVDYQKATFSGNGTLYLWFRVPLQVFFIVWTWFCALRT